MIIKVKRTKFNLNNTLGEMFINNNHFCYTIEDRVRDINNDGDLDDIGETKVYGETAIPKGEYKLILSISNRFKILMPEILNVKGFTGIRIHKGNSAIDSHGCIIIGMLQNNTGVQQSKIAFDKLMIELKNKKDIRIIIE